MADIFRQFLKGSGDSERSTREAENLVRLANERSRIIIQRMNEAMRPLPAVDKAQK